MVYLLAISIAIVGCKDTFKVNKKDNEFNVLKVRRGHSKHYQSSDLIVDIQDIHH